MWLEAVYNPTSLFSLRKSDATSPAAKTLLSPSPYAVKMALINAAITFFSKEFAINNFNLIRDMEIRFCMQEYLGVNNCFIKIQKEPKDKKSDNAFQPTVAFREYVYFDGPIKILFNINNDEELNLIKSLLVRINYFGKRGCFFQIVDFNLYRDNAILEGYSFLFSENVLDINKEMILIKMDDFDFDVTFDEINTYSDEKVKRRSSIYCFCYKQLKANKNFTLYKKSV